MELEKSVRMMERNVMAMEVTTFFFFFILIIPKAITLRITISLINILSIIVIIRIIILIMDANLGGKPRGRRLWGKAEVRGAEAAQHAGQEVDAMVNEWWGWIMMKYLDDNDKVRGAEAAQYAGQDD